MDNISKGISGLNFAFVFQANFLVNSMIGSNNVLFKEKAVLSFNSGFDLKQFYKHIQMLFWVVKNAKVNRKISGCFFIYWQ